MNAFKVGDLAIDPSGRTVKVIRTSDDGMISVRLTGDYGATVRYPDSTLRQPEDVGVAIDVKRFALRTVESLDALEQGAKSRLVYLAGPIAADPPGWFERATQYFDACVKWAELNQLNLNFFLPHLSIAGENVVPQKPSVWLGIDGAIMRHAAAVLEIPHIEVEPRLNFSSGRDAERMFAQQRKIPWFIGQPFYPVNGSPNAEFARAMRALCK